MKINILENKMLNASPDKAKILAAMMDPLNMELKQQISDYVVLPGEEDDDAESGKVHKKDPKDGKKVSDNDAEKDPEDKGEKRPEPASFEDGKSDDGEEGPDGDNDKKDEKGKKDGDSEDEKEVDSSSKPTQSAVMASSVTVDEVATAVNEIPGMLNLRDGTKGVTHAVLKGGSDNEVWVYFDSDTDINKVLEAVNSAVTASGYYFLAFNRVSRDDNAIVYSINWVSSYFNPSAVGRTSDSE